MPGHGTVPAALTREGRKEWQRGGRDGDGRSPAPRRRPLAGPPGRILERRALAMLHVMERIERGQPGEVDRIVLVSPMIEVSRFARYAGLAGWPALFGRYAKSAWLDLLPEYNPFKYNSFPVRAARESYLVTDDLRAAMEAVARQERMDRGAADPGVPVGGRRHRQRPRRDDAAVRQAGGQWQRAGAVRRQPQPRHRADVARGGDRLAARRACGPGAPLHAHAGGRGFGRGRDAWSRARDRPARARCRSRPTGLHYPDDVYSLSHIALPFPADDPLYGNRPSGAASCSWARWRCAASATRWWCRRTA